MSGLFCRGPSCGRRGGTPTFYERSTVETGRPRRRDHHPSGAAGRASQRAAPARATSASKSRKRIALDRGRARPSLRKYLPQILTSWDRLQRLLRETIDAARYHLGHTFEARGAGRLRRPSVHFAGGPQRNVPISSSAATVSARGVRAQGRARDPADLFRLLHLARRAERSRSRAADARKHFPLTSRSSCRSGSRSSAIPSPD